MFYKIIVIDLRINHKKKMFYLQTGTNTLPTQYNVFSQILKGKYFEKFKALYLNLYTVIFQKKL